MSMCRCESCEKIVDTDVEDEGQTLGDVWWCFDCWDGADTETQQLALTMGWTEP